MRKLSYLLVAVLFLGVIACAKPPQDKMDLVVQALDTAKTAEAALYAGDSLRAAEDAQAAMQAEIDTQGQKFALFRSYKKAIELATAAEEAAKKTEQDAIAGKEKARMEAETLINEAKTAIATATEDLKKAPKGKGAQTDIAQLKADLDGATATVTEADTEYSNGKYLDAKAKAQSAKDSAATVSADIMKAIEMKKGLMKR